MNSSTGKRVLSVKHGGGFVMVWPEWMPPLMNQRIMKRMLSTFTNEVNGIFVPISGLYSQRSSTFSSHLFSWVFFHY